MYNWEFFIYLCFFAFLVKELLNMKYFASSIYSFAAFAILYFLCKLENKKSLRMNPSSYKIYART